MSLRRFCPLLRFFRAVVLALSKSDGLSFGPSALAGICASLWYGIGYNPVKHSIADLPASAVSVATMRCSALSRRTARKARRADAGYCAAHLVQCAVLERRVTRLRLLCLLSPHSAHRSSAALRCDVPCSRVWFSMRMACPGRRNELADVPG